MTVAGSAAARDAGGARVFHIAAFVAEVFGGSPVYSHDHGGQGLGRAAGTVPAIASDCGERPCSAHGHARGPAAIDLVGAPVSPEATCYPFAMESLVIGNEGAFAFRLAVCLVLGALTGVERELRNKPAGISTHCFVMAGACLFTFASITIDPNSPARIAAQVVSGVGFLGAGMILKSENNKVKNLTTAAAIWFAAAIGMVVGLGWYLVGALATAYAIVVPRIPHVKSWLKSDFDE